MHNIQNIGPEQFEAVFDLLCELRPHLQAQTFAEQLTLQFSQGYRLLAIKVQEQFVAAAGYRISSTLARGPHLFVDDLVTLQSHQKLGFGKLLLRALQQIALEQNLPRVYLDSRDSAKSFYAGCGFAFLTSIPAWIASDAQIA